MRVVCLFVGYCVLYDARCVLSVVCCLAAAVCYSVCVVRSLLFAV